MSNLVGLSRPSLKSSRSGVVLTPGKWFHCNGFHCFDCFVIFVQQIAYFEVWFRLQVDAGSHTDTRVALCRRLDMQFFHHFEWSWSEIQPRRLQISPDDSPLLSLWSQSARWSELDTIDSSKDEINARLKVLLELHTWQHPDAHTHTH